MIKKVSRWLFWSRLSMVEKVMLGAFGLFAFVYPFGILLLSFGWMPFGMDWMGSLLLALMGAAAGAWLIVNFGTWGAIAGIMVYAAGMLLEGIGVNTGLLFGNYSYTEVLIPRLPSGVPLPIGFAWVLVVVSGLAAARWLFGARGGYSAGRNALLSLAGAVLAVGLDLLLEPVAYHVTRYWIWEGGDAGGGYYGVPWSNALTWLAAVFVLNLLITFKANMWGRLRALWVPVALYIMTVVMFTIVGLAHGFWLAGVVGAVLLGVMGWRLWPLMKMGLWAKRISPGG